MAVSSRLLVQGGIASWMIKASSCELCRHLGGASFRDAMQSTVASVGAEDPGARQPVSLCLVCGVCHLCHLSADNPISDFFTTGPPRLRPTRAIGLWWHVGSKFGDATGPLLPCPRKKAHPSSPGLPSPMNDGPHGIMAHPYIGHSPPSGSVRGSEEQGLRSD